jgi:peptide/nickel transport system permease protein
MRGFAASLLRGTGVVLGVLTLTFVLLHLAPGDPVQRLLGAAATPAQVDAATRSLGLDQPLATQYANWLGRAVRGDFGVSIAEGRPVAAILADAWPATAILVILSIVLSWFLGVLLGAWQAGIRNRALDGITSAATISLHAIPSYWLGLVLVMLFTYQLGMLPAFGAEGLDADFLTPWERVIDRARHIALPLATLTLVGVGGIARFVRGAMRDIRDAEFLVVARSKGITPRRVLWAHQLRNALIPLIALLGLTLPALFSGAVFVEAIFAWPGVGQVLVQAVQARDYPVVMAAAAISSILVVAGNLLADALLRIADPRSDVVHDVG